MARTSGDDGALKASYASQTMNALAIAKFQSQYRKIQSLHPYPWEDLGKWILETRLLIKAAFPDHLDDFDRHTREPSWIHPVLDINDPYGNRHANGQGPLEVEDYNSRAAWEAKDKIAVLMRAILELVPIYLSRPPTQPAAPQSVHHVHHGDRYENHFSNSNIGAVASGRGATAYGNATATFTQAEHRKVIKSAEVALVADEDAINALGQGVYDALWQFLRVAREIQVEQKQVAELVRLMKDTLDDVWAERMGDNIKPKLPKTLAVAKELLASPMMAEVVKEIISGT